MFEIAGQPKIVELMSKRCAWRDNSLSDHRNEVWPELGVSAVCVESFYLCRYRIKASVRRISHDPRHRHWGREANAVPGEGLYTNPPLGNIALKDRIF